MKNSKDFYNETLPNLSHLVQRCSWNFKIKNFQELPNRSLKNLSFLQLKGVGMSMKDSCTFFPLLISLVLQCIYMYSVRKTKEWQRTGTEYSSSKLLFRTRGWYGTLKKWERLEFEIVLGQLLSITCKLYNFFITCMKYTYISKTSQDLLVNMILECRAIFN